MPKIHLLNTEMKGVNTCTVNYFLFSVLINLDYFLDICFHLDLKEYFSVDQCKKAKFNQP